MGNSKTMKHFHNTIQLNGIELLVADGKCKNQDQVILAYFDKHSSISFTPFEVQEGLSLYRTPITSIRRSITNLTTDGHLENTGEQAMGIYDKPNYKWRRRVTKGQQTMF